MGITNYQNEAYDTIKEMILKAELKPGQKISLRELVIKLKIGDTPIREAIIRLRKEGLFRVVPQSGTYVSKINLQEVYEARFVRENIEKLVFEEACDLITDEQIIELEKKIKIQQIYIDTDDQDTYFQLDEEFHEFFYEVACKKYVWNWIQQLNIQLNRYRYLRLELKELSWDTITDEHKAIVSLVKDKKRKELGKAISAHLHMIDKDSKVVLAAFPDYFETENKQSNF